MKKQKGLTHCLNGLTISYDKDKNNITNIKVYNRVLSKKKRRNIYNDAMGLSNSNIKRLWIQFKAWIKQLIKR